MALTDEQTNQFVVAASQEAQAPICKREYPCKQVLSYHRKNGGLFAMNTTSNSRLRPM